MSGNALQEGKSDTGDRSVCMQIMRQGCESGNKDLMPALLPPGCRSGRAGTSAGHLVRNRKKRVTWQEAQIKAEPSGRRRKILEDSSKSRDLWDHLELAITIVPAKWQKGKITEVSLLDLSPSGQVWFQPDWSHTKGSGRKT